MENNLKSLMILIIFCLFVCKLAFKCNIDNNIIMVCMFITLVINNNNETFASESTANEAVANIASMYNPDTKTLQLSNLKLTGNIEASGTISSGNITCHNITTGNIDSNNNIKGKTLTIDDDAVIGPAYVGSYMGTDKDYAQFSNNAMKSGAGSYAFVQHKDGDSYVNASNGKTLHFGTNDSKKSHLKGSESLLKFDDKIKMKYRNNHHKFGELNIHVDNHTRLIASSDVAGHFSLHKI